MEHVGESQVAAFILLEAKSGQALGVSRQIAEIEGVVASYAVTGPFDLIVHVEAADFRSIAQMVVTEIQKLPGVARTLTCLVVESSQA